MAVLLGIKRFTSTKSGEEKKYEVIVLGSEVTTYEKEKGSVGIGTFQEIFVPEKFIGTIKNSDLNKQVFIDYEKVVRNNEERFYVKDIVIK